MAASASEHAQYVPAVKPQPFFSEVGNARELVEVPRWRSRQIADQWIAQHHRGGHLSLCRLGGPERAQCLPALSLRRIHALRFGHLDPKLALSPAGKQLGG